MLWARQPPFRGNLMLSDGLCECLLVLLVFGVIYQFFMPIIKKAGDPITLSIWRDTNIVLSVFMSFPVQRWLCFRTPIINDVPGQQKHDNLLF